MSLTIGTTVSVLHDQGVETGIVHGFNEKTGKVDVYFDYEACPHLCRFNIWQVVEVAS